MPTKSKQSIIRLTWYIKILPHPGSVRNSSMNLMCIQIDRHRNNYTSIYDLVIYLYYLCLLRAWFLNTILQEESGLLRKRLILGLGQRIHKMILEHLTVPESKEVFKTQKAETCQRDTGANMKELLTAKAATTWATTWTLYYWMITPSTKEIHMEQQWYK